MPQEHKVYQGMPLRSSGPHLDGLDENQADSEACVLMAVWHCLTNKGQVLRPLGNLSFPAL